MKHLTTKLAVTIFTFTIGLTAAAIWFSQPDKRFANDIYFPVGVFSPYENEQNWAIKSISNGLTAMQEPSLSTFKDKNVEAYRFLWFRSFHPPVSVRLWRNGNQSFLSVKQLSSVGVPQEDDVIFPKTLTVNETRSVTEKEWEYFQESLKKARFWSMPTVDETSIGVDGAAWLLEGLKLNQYHVVIRNSPKQGDYRDTCLYLLRISEVRVDESKGELY